jgi:RHS repeat-associated protein
MLSQRHGAHGYRGELTINGSVHLRARDYSPGPGTFTKTDPLLGVAGTTTVANPYHYTDNDPLNKTDPSG